MNADGALTESSELTAAISAAMVELYAAFYDHHVHQRPHRRLRA